MRKRCMLFFGAVCLSGAALAEASELYSDKKAGFSVRYPTRWVGKANHQGIPFQLQSPDKSITVRIVKEKTKRATSLEKFIGHLENKYRLGVNQSLGGDEGCRSHTDIFPFDECSHRFYITWVNDKEVINEDVTIYRRGTFMYVLMQKFSGEETVRALRELGPPEIYFEILR